MIQKSDHNQSLDHWYWKLLDCDDTERSRMLAELEHSNREIAELLRKMLDVPDDLGSFMRLPESVDQHVESPTPGLGETTDSKPTAPRKLDAFRVPRIVGPYKLLEAIGEGGMGMVFLAQQSKPVRRKVALKIIKPGMDSRQVIARFEAERQALAMMEHTNIAKVLDAGTTEMGLPYFVMELVRGIPMTDYCDQAKMPNRRRLELFCDACNAIQHAHNKGIIHRDIKPSNVLITEHDSTPVVKIIDFGVAKALTNNLTDKTMFTGMFQMIGTPLYMSPEQASLSNHDVDTRSDVYSLGVLLYELISGTLPIDRQTAKELSLDELCKQICETEPPRPSKRLSTLKVDRETVVQRRGIELKAVHRAIPGELDWIVMRAIEKDRKRRYQSAREFGEDIRRYLDGEIVEACPPSIAYRSTKYVRKHRWLIATAGCVLSTALVGTLVSIRYATHANYSAAKARTSRVKAEKLAADYKSLVDIANQNEAAAVEASDRARTAAKLSIEAQSIAEARTRQLRQLRYQSDIRLAETQIDQGLHSEAMATLVNHAPELADEDIRGWEWYELLGKANLSSHSWQASASEVVGIVWSPDGSEIATIDHEGTCKLWNAGTGKLVRKWDLTQVAGCSVTWSPCGRYLAWGYVRSDEPVRIWDRETDLVDSVPISGGSVFCLEFDSNSKLLLAGTSGSPTISMHRLESGHWRRVWESNFEGNGTFVGWDKSGELAYGTSHEGQLYRFKSETGERTELALPDISGRRLEVASYSTATGRMAMNCVNGWCAILEPESGRETLRMECHWSTFHSAWSPDGQYLATAGADGFVKVWDPSDGTLIRKFSGHLGGAHRVTWKADSSAVASCGADGLVFVWPISKHPSDKIIPLNGHTDWPRTVQTQPRIHWFDNDHVRYIRANDTVAQLDVRDAGEQILRRLDPNLGRWRLIDCETAACLDRDSQIVEWTDPHLFPITQGHPLASLALHQSASGTKIAIVAPGYGGDPSILHDDGTQLTSLANQNWGTCHRIRWSPDGSQLAIASRGFASDSSVDARAGWVYLLDGESGRLIARDLVGESRINARAVAWSPDGDWIASGSDSGTCEVRRADKLTKQFSQRHHRATIWDIAWHPDGRRVASTGADQKVVVWDARTGEVLRSLRLPTSGDSVSWSPNGDCLAVLTKDRQLCVWNSRQGQEFVHASSWRSIVSRELKTRLKNAMAATDVAEVERLLTKETGQLAELELATFFIECGRFERAQKVLQDFLTAREHSPSYLHYHHALLCLMNRDEEGYANRSRTIWDLFHQSDDPQDIAWVFWVQALFSADDVVGQQTIELGDRILEQRPEVDEALNFFIAAFLFRAGQFERAAHLMQPHLDESTSSISPAYIRFFYAMTQHHLGKETVSREWLDKANEFVSQQRKNGDTGDTSLTWNRLATFKLLAAEAEQLINAEQPD